MFQKNLWDTNNMKMKNLNNKFLLKKQMNLLKITSKKIKISKTLLMIKILKCN